MKTFFWTLFGAIFVSMVVTTLKAGVQIEVRDQTVWMAITSSPSPAV